MPWCPCGYDSQEFRRAARRCYFPHDYTLLNVDNSGREHRPDLHRCREVIAQEIVHRRVHERHPGVLIDVVHVRCGCLAKMADAGSSSQLFFHFACTQSKVPYHFDATELPADTSYLAQVVSLCGVHSAACHQFLRLEALPLLQGTCHALLVSEQSCCTAQCVPLQVGPAAWGTNIGVACSWFGAAMYCITSRGIHLEARRRCSRC